MATREERFFLFNLQPKNETLMTFVSGLGIIILLNWQREMRERKRKVTIGLLCVSADKWQNIK